MKKFVIVALIGLGISLVSCIKDEMYDDGFKVETLTKMSHKYPQRGTEPLEIISESYGLSKNGGTGVISTNYGDIVLKFPKVEGLKVSSHLKTILVTDYPFFLHGGHIIMNFSDNEGVFKTDSIQFDIIAPDDKIDEWKNKGRSK